MRVRHDVLILAVLASAVVVPTVASAQAAQVSAGDLQCIPWERHSVVTAQVSGAPAGSMVRMYFRRLHEEVEDLYWIELRPRGNGQYWGVLPKPANDQLDRKRLEQPESTEQSDNPQAAWWLAKDRSDDRDPNDDLNEQIIEERAAEGKQLPRDWMRALSLPDLESFLRSLTNEPVEYYAELVDVNGKSLARSPVKVAKVTSPDACDAPSVVHGVDYQRLMDDENPSPQLVQRAREAGQSYNLTVGETADWQIGRQVFHWLCDGVVSRVDYRGIPREDDVCRTCAFGFLRHPERLFPAVAGITVLPPPASPIEP